MKFTSFTEMPVWQKAHKLALDVYGLTASFPKAEQFGLVPQMRRAAVSIGSNIVEGCARHTEADYLHFLDMAYGSARELEYQLSLAQRLGLAEPDACESMHRLCEETSKVLNGLIRSLRR